LKAETRPFACERVQHVKTAPIGSLPFKKLIYMENGHKKVARRASKPWITQEMIIKMDQRRKWKNIYYEEKRKNYRRVRNEKKKATEKTKQEHRESVFEESREFQRTERYGLKNMKTKEDEVDEEEKAIK
jgi:hypothetical protein